MYLTTTSLLGSPYILSLASTLFVLVKHQNLRALVMVDLQCSNHHILVQDLSMTSCES